MYIGTVAITIITTLCGPCDAQIVIVRLTPPFLVFPSGELSRCMECADTGWRHSADFEEPDHGSFRATQYGTSCYPAFMEIAT